MLEGMTLGRDATIALLSLGVVLGACAMHSEPSGVPAPEPPRLRSAELLPASPARVPLRGTDFPDGVIALTWDDGPDVHTLELARFLHEQHVSATFFAVAAWIDGLSEEPGYGQRKLATGYYYEPVLSDLIALGHRVGNHALNHVLLGHATADLAHDQFLPLPLPDDRVKIFRVPAGWWTAESAAAFDQPELSEFIGPIHWDIDAKDWESSLYCRSDSPKTECERGPKPNEPRVRPDVVAHRYLAKIESWKHGIVLLHDRVGDVGSRYALDVAKTLVPALVARGYVFAPPVLRFGPLTNRSAPPSRTHDGDLNGDGRADHCERTRDGIACALAAPKGLLPATVWSTEPAADFALADVNDDGRADLVVGQRVALAP